MSRMGQSRMVNSAIKFTQPFRLRINTPDVPSALHLTRGISERRESQ